MQTIAFYSYKGGTGRSLVVANVARYLAQFGQSVVALDFDLEAPGLHYKLEMDEADKNKKPIQGFVDYFDSFSAAGKFPASLRDYLYKVKRLSNEQADIFLFPAGNAPSVQYWEKLSRINWHEWFYVPQAKGVHFFLELKEMIKEEFKPDFLLVDSRTGITEIGGVATTILPEKVVCLFLANQENLEGTRTVVRSLRKTPRITDSIPPIDIISVLTRIPEDTSIEKEEVLLKEIRDFFNEPAENLEDTLSINDIFVLHSEPDLQVNECLRVGGSKSPDESVLLRDYLLLFAVLIPPEIVMPYVEPLLKQARNKAFEDPDSAEKILVSLTHLGHPEVYRELLRFYRLRKASSEVILSTAQRLWALIKQGDDPVLWNAIKENFEEVQPSEIFPFTLECIEAAWHGAGSNNVKIGCALAESYDNFKNPQHAINLLKCLLEKGGSDESAVSILLRLLNRSEQLEEVENIIEKYRKDFEGSPNFILQWASHALLRDDGKYLDELSNSPLIDILTKTEESIAIHVLLKKDKSVQASLIITRLIGKKGLRDPGINDELGKFFRIYNIEGRSDEFDQIISSSLSKEESNEFLRRMHGYPLLRKNF